MARLIVIAIFVYAWSATAQTADNAAIFGRVTDQTRSALAAVELTAVNVRTGLERTARSDAAGAFTFAALPVNGGYVVSAAAAGFAPAHTAELTLSAGSTATVTIELSIAAGQTEVTVTGVAGEVRADQPQLGVHLDARQIEATPLLNSKITYLPLLNAANRPAINQGDVFINQNLFTTNGAGRRQIWFVVDGATGNDSWGRQTIFSTLPVTAVEEMTVLVNGFSAEYGGSTGSAVNIVTKSGGDRFHGEARELWRPEATAAALSGFTTANAANGNDLTSDTLGQSDVALSGPAGSSGRTRFYTAAEYSREDRGSPGTSPVAPGIFVGHYRGWLGFIRLDHRLGSGNNLFFRGILDAFHDTNPNGAVGGNNLPSVDRVFRRRTYSAELGETAVLSPSLLNTARLQFQIGSPITQFDPVINGTQYQVPISTGGTFTSGTSQSALLINRQYQASDTVGTSWGRHQVSFGADIIAAHSGGNSKEFGGPIYQGQFVYNTCTLALTVCESPAYLNNIANVRSYTQSYGNANYTVDDTLWSLFVQDNFHIRPDLTINLGLRYERQTFTDANKNVGPRVGFAYNWGGRGDTVVRSGFGIYYSQIVDNAAANWALTGPTGVFNYTASSGQIGFPPSVSAAPLPAFPVGAAIPLRNLYIRPGQSRALDQFFPTSILSGYPDRLLNPYSQQWTFGIERRLRRDWVIAVDYVGAHTLRINRPLNVNPPAPFTRTLPGQVRSAQAANCTRPYWIWWYRQQGTTCNPLSTSNPQPLYAVIQSDVNNGSAYYEALDVNLTHRFNTRFSMLASYTWSHAIDTVDPDVPGQNPNDPNFTGAIERGNAIFDQRHRFVLSGFVLLPWKLETGGVATLASGLPFNYTTGVANSGDIGATTDRPVLGNVVVGRNTGRGRPIYDVAPFLQRTFALGGERIGLQLRAEAFNVFNHANFAGYSGTYGNGASAGAGFGQPLPGIANQMPARSMQFLVRVSF